MRLLHKQLKHLYDRLIEDVQGNNSKLLILPAMTVDALCASKILCSLIQRLHEYVQYTVMPVRGMTDVLVTVESAIANLEKNKKLSVVCLDHSAGVDLLTQFKLNDPSRLDRVFFTIIDSHRPFHLKNLLMGNFQVRCVLSKFDRVGDWEEVFPLDIPSDDEDYYFTDKRTTYRHTEDEDDDNYFHNRAKQRYSELIGGEHISDNELDGDASSKRHKRVLRDDDDSDESAHLGYDDDQENAGAFEHHDLDDGYSQEDEDDDDGHEEGIDDEEERQRWKQHKAQERQRRRALLNNRQRDDEHEEGSSTGGTKKRKQVTQAKLEAIPQRPKITWEEAVAKYDREPMARSLYRRNCTLWYRTQTYSTPTSIMVYDMASLKRVQQSNLLWCALLGLHESFMLEKCPSAQYLELFQYLSNTIDSNGSIDSNPAHSHSLHSVHDVDREEKVVDVSVSDATQFSRSRNAHFAALGQEMVPDTTLRLKADKKLANDGGYAMTMQLEHKLTLGSFTQNKYEFIFPFFRHWNLYESFLNTPAVILGFRLHRGEEGLKNLKQVLARIPIPLKHAQRKYNLLSKSEIQFLYRSAAGHLEQYNIFQPYFSTFVTKVSSSLILNLSDFTSTLLQYLDTVVCTCSDDHHHNTPQSLQLLNFLLSQPHDTQLARSQNQSTHSYSDSVLQIGSSTCSFWSAYNLLSSSSASARGTGTSAALSTDENVFKLGLASGMKQYQAINTLAQALFKMDHRLITRNDNEYMHYCIIPTQSFVTHQDLLLLTNYSSLTLLAFRLQELIYTTYYSRQNQTFPFFLFFQLPNSTYTLCLGVNPIIKTVQQVSQGGVITTFSRNSYSHFHDFLERSAQTMKVLYIRDSFEPNLIYIKTDDVSKFIDQSALFMSRKETKDLFYGRQ